MTCFFEHGNKIQKKTPTEGNISGMTEKRVGRLLKFESFCPSLGAGTVLLEARPRLQGKCDAEVLWGPPDVALRVP